MNTFIYFNSILDKRRFNRLPYILFRQSIDTASIIHSGRNTIWTTNLNNTVLVVKMFGNGLKSKFLYSFRASKAKRSMCNAIELQKLGVSTPTPIAFAEKRNILGFLQRCWFVSEYEESMSYAEALLIYGTDVADAFAGFVAELHEKGILHNDLNNSNVRVKVSPKCTFHFSLIDLNRMRIYPKGKTIPNPLWMKDVCRFCHIDNGFMRFISQYLRMRHLPNSLSKDMIKAKRKHDRKNEFLHKFKKIIKL